MVRDQLQAVIHQLQYRVSARETGGLTDAQLLERFVSARDEAAFEVLLWRHGPMVLGLCRRLLHGEIEIEDAFQGTFLIFVRKAGSIGKHQAVGSWLYKVAYRVALASRKEGEKRCRGERLLAGVADPGFTEDPAWRDLRPVLDEEIGRLPEKYRAAFVLCYLESKTNEQAARELGCPKGTVLSRLAWAREWLRTRLLRRGVTLSTGLLAGMFSANAAPAVPTRLTTATLRSLQAAATGSLSSPAATLVEGVARATSLARLKAWAIVCLAMGVLATGAGLAARQALEPAKQAEVVQPPSASSDQSRTDAARPPRLDRYGDLLPPGAVARLGTVRLRHAANVSAVAFTPGDKELVSASFDGTLALWDAASGKLLRRYRGHGDWILQAVVSPDGKRIASAGSDKTLRLWDRATGKEIRQLPGHSDKVLNMAFTPTGDVLYSVSQDRTIRKWHTASGAEVGQWPVTEAMVQQSAFSPDAKWLGLALADNTFCLWDLEAGRVRHRFPEGQGSASPLAFSADGRLLAAVAADKTIHVWRVDTGKEEPRIPLSVGEGFYYWALRFSPDGKYLAAGGNALYDAAIHLYDRETRKEARALRGHFGGIHSLQFSADGRTLASAGVDSTLRLWDVAAGREKNPEHGHGGKLCDVAVSPDGKFLASAGFDQTVRVWDLATGNELHRLTGHQSLVCSLAFSPEGRALYSGSLDNTIRTWDPKSGKELHPPLDQVQGKARVALTPDGKTLVVADGQGRIRYRDAESGKDLRTTAWTVPPLYQLEFTPRGKILGVAMDQSNPTELLVSLWELDTAKPLARFPGQPRRAYRLPCELTVSPNGRLAAVSGGGMRTVRLVELSSGKEWGELGEFPEEINALAFAPGGRTLATACWDGALRLWDVYSGKLLTTLSGEQGHIGGLVFSPDGKTLYSGGSDTTVLAWDVTPLNRRDQIPARRLSREVLESLWEELGSTDMRKANQALQNLAAAPGQAPRFLKEHVPPPAPVDAKVVAQHIADLDNERFAVRKNAMQELEKLGSRIKPELGKALEKQPSLETTQRLKALLEQVSDPFSSQENLRWLRALEILEAINTADARAVLETLSTGTAGDFLAEEANASLARLARRPATRP